MRRSRHCEEMFALAVRRGAISTNPIRDTGRLRKPRQKVVALTDEDLQAVRAAIRQWELPVAGKSGPRHTGDLSDVVDLMLATGARIGEVLAVRWDDLYFGAERSTLTISGTLVYLKGQGVARQDWTKSDAGFRTLVLPNFAVGMLLSRKVAASVNPLDAIFATRRGTWLARLRACGQQSFAAKRQRQPGCLKSYLGRPADTGRQRT